MTQSEQHKPQNPQQNPQQDQGRGFLGVLQSVVAAIFGIQSDQNRQKDFKKGDASQFITMGIVAVVAIMITMAIIVHQVLESAGQ